MDNIHDELRQVCQMLLDTRTVDGVKRMHEHRVRVTHGERYAFVGINPTAKRWRLYVHRTHRAGDNRRARFGMPILNESRVRDAVREVME